MKLEFLGAVREVTGSKHLLTLDNGTKILLDCGMYQGKGLNTDSMNRDLGFEPSEIDYLILTHAHIDHAGLIPYIYKNGFKGRVFCTPATRDLASIMLADSGKIQEYDTIQFNKKRERQGLPPVEPIYTHNDAMRCMHVFMAIPYHLKFHVNNTFELTFTDSGHILGSATANLLIRENGREIKIAYTGDIGRSENRILNSPEPFPQADYIITESTYGNRLHDSITLSEEALLEIVRETCAVNKGKLIIPAFSLGRTQELVFSLNNLWNKKLLPQVQIFVDSPLSTNATQIFRLHPECFNQDVLELMLSDPDPFGFNNLHYIEKVNASKALNARKEACVIISASGMAEAGRIKHHLANNISNSANTVLFVGYCAPETLGAKIKNGYKRVSIHGNEYDVRARVCVLESYSAHGDYKEMSGFLSCQKPDQVKGIFLVHGEYDSQLFYSDVLREKGFTNISVPKMKDSVIL